VEQDSQAVGGTTHTSKRKQGSTACKIAVGRHNGIQDKGINREELQKEQDVVQQ